MVTEYAEGTYVIDNEYAKIWCHLGEKAENAAYCYGGTRTVSVDMPAEEVYNKLIYLGKYESGLKNKLINLLIKDGVFAPLDDRMPDGFEGSVVEGGRCIIQPKSEELFAAVTDTTHQDHKKVLDSIFADLGEFLNSLGGSLKLTPDFGRFAGLADMLHKYTENVLGIDCNDGGCGGKASYTSTGIIQAAETMGAEKESPITIIGSAGACGTGVLDYFIEKGYTDVAVCDLYYDNTDEGKKFARELEEKNIKVLHSCDGKFTSECLGRGGMIIAITVGGEFLNSNVSAIKDDSILLMAHNECIRVCDESFKRIDELLKEKNIIIIPGQLLTFGGALTSRIERFYRESKKGTYFDKPLAHSGVRLAADAVMKKYCTGSYGKNLFKQIYAYTNPKNNNR